MLELILSILALTCSLTAIFALVAVFKVQEWRADTISDDAGKKIDAVEVHCMNQLSADVSHAVRSLRREIFDAKQEALRQFRDHQSKAKSQSFKRDCELAKIERRIATIEGKLTPANLCDQIAEELKRAESLQRLKQ